MGRPREPISLVQAKGKKHLTKAEIKARQEQEVKVDLKNVTPPSYLPEKLIKEFNEIADKLLHIGIMTELDSDCLARYLLSKQTYLQCTALLTNAIKKNNVSDMEKLMQLQDKAFKQTQSSARDLGLTISSRCKLIMPEVKEVVKTNKFNKFK